MNVDPLQINDIISRFKNGQSVRAISRELGVGRHRVASCIRQHQVQTQSLDTTSPPASLGPLPLTRKSKLDPFIDPLTRLLQRYPKANIRAFTATGAASGKLTEADALIAYLQSLGTEVDFKLYDDKANVR